jgi:hypothetical protein
LVSGKIGTSLEISKIFEFCNLGSLRSGKNLPSKSFMWIEMLPRVWQRKHLPSPSLKLVILFLGEKSAKGDTKSKIWQKFCFFHKKSCQISPKNCFYGGCIAIILSAGYCFNGPVPNHCQLSWNLFRMLTIVVALWNWKK